MKFDTVSFISELIKYKSVSADSTKADEIRSCAEFLKEKICAIGFEGGLLETAGSPIVYLKRACTSGEPKARILCYGHYDVQPAEPLEQWNTNPFEPVLKDGKLWGRGAADNKGPFSCLLAGLANFLAENPDAPIDFGIILEGEEEVGSGSVIKFIKENATEFSGYDYVVLSDTSSVSQEQIVVTIGLRGMCSLEARFKGANIDAHSGMFGGAVYNPLRAMYEVCASLHDADGFVNVPEFYEELPKLSDWERSQIAASPFDENTIKAQLGLKHLAKVKGYTPAEALRVLPTLEFVGTGGGHIGEGMKSIIPAECFCKILCRTVVGQDSSRAVASLKYAIADRCPKEVEVSFIESEGAGNAYFVNPKAEPYDQRSRRLSSAFTAVDKCVCEVFGKAPLYLREGASIGLISEIKKYTGLDCIMVGLFIPEDNLHAPNEGFSLATIEKGSEYYQKFFTEIAK